MMNDQSRRWVLLIALAVMLPMVSCSRASEETRRAADQANAHPVQVDPTFFMTEALVGEVLTEERTISDGSRVMCYVYQTRSVPIEHEMGPWSPGRIDDDKEAGGIWLRDGQVYDVDGPFVRNMAEFYDDPEWKLYRDDGTIKVTDTKEAFEAAARPDVDPKYHNHMVEGRPEWIEPTITTYIIPVQPIYNLSPAPFGRGGGIGVAFNGVNFDPPAPLHAILGAHTIAPFDDAGGHLNPHAGYHYHAATGKTKQIEQPDGHAPMIGYALDGFGLYAHMDGQGHAADGLDECGGHFDETRGYHYHAGSPGSNQIIRAFRGTPGLITTED